MKILGLVCAISCVFAYRDGARENSCYDHSIVHDGAETFPCVPEPWPCPFFLRIREVVDEDTLQLGNETNTYQCEKIYGIELANTLNDPEGFLIQARNGTSVSSEIVGTFLDPSVVNMRNQATLPINYKILSCNRSISNEPRDPLPNSATHPRTVDMAGVLQLYWQAPNCSTCGLGDVRIWFTAVQQLQIVFSTSKDTELMLQNHTEPLECSSVSTTTSSSGGGSTTLTSGSGRGSIMPTFGSGSGGGSITPMSSSEVSTTTGSSQRKDSDKLYYYWPGPIPASQSGCTRLGAWG